MTSTRPGAMARKSCVQRRSACPRATSNRSGLTKDVGSISSRRVKGKGAGTWIMHSRSRTSGYRTASNAPAASVRRGRRLQQRERHALEAWNIDLEHDVYGALAQARTLTRRPAERVAATSREAGIDIH